MRPSNSGHARLAAKHADSGPCNPFDSKLTQNIVEHVESEERNERQLFLSPLSYFIWTVNSTRYMADSLAISTPIATMSRHIVLHKSHGNLPLMTTGRPQQIPSVPEILPATLNAGAPASGTAVFEDSLLRCVWHAHTDRHYNATAGRTQHEKELWQKRK